MFCEENSIFQVYVLLCAKAKAQFMLNTILHSNSDVRMPPVFQWMMVDNTTSNYGESLMFSSKDQAVQLDDKNKLFMFITVLHCNIDIKRHLFFYLS